MFHFIWLPSRPEPQPPNKSLRRSAVGCLATYLFGLFLFFPYIVSIILSIRIAKRGYLVGFKAGFGMHPLLGSLTLPCLFPLSSLLLSLYSCSSSLAVIFCSVIEAIAWSLCACFGWYFKTNCYQYTDGSYMAAVEDHCHSTYWGWVSFT